MAETSDVHPPYLYPDYKSTRLRAPSQPLVRVAPSPLEAVSPALGAPKAIRCDHRDNVMVVDTEDHAIRRIDAVTG